MVDKLKKKSKLDILLIIILVKKQTETVTEFNNVLNSNTKVALE